MLTVSSFFRLSLPHDNNGKISPCTCIGLLFLLLIDLVNRPSLSHGNSPVSIKLSLASVEHHSSQSVDFHRRSILPCSILFLLLWQVLLSLSVSTLLLFLVHSVHKYIHLCYNKQKSLGDNEDIKVDSVSNTCDKDYTDKTSTEGHIHLFSRWSKYPNENRWPCVSFFVENDDWFIPRIDCLSTDSIHAWLRLTTFLRRLVFDRGCMNRFSSCSSRWSLLSTIHFVF